MNNNKEQLVKLCTEHFFTHPHWDSVLALINLYIDPLKNVRDIDPKMSNDQIATEVRGRQIAYEKLDRFVKDTLTLRSIKEKVSTKSTRKFK